MSLWDWLSGGRRRTGPSSSPAGPVSSGLSRENGDVTRPMRAAAPRAPATAAGARTSRVEQRERLYSVVRESMVRSGVLSSGYKFKVLSLDSHSRQFLVMMDLAREFGREPARLSEIEALIAQTARQRFGLGVSAVYWRLNEQVVVSLPQARPVSAPAPLTATSAAVSAPAPAPVAAPARAAAAPLPPVAVSERAQPQPPLAMPGAAHGATGRYEPIQADEIEAFRNALSASVNHARAQTAARLDAKAEAQLRAAREDDFDESGPPSVAPSPSAPAAAAPARRGLQWPRRQPAHLTGYEDTEAFDPQERSPGLSETQYGDLN